MKTRQITVFVVLNAIELTSGWADGIRTTVRWNGSASVLLSDRAIYQLLGHADKLHGSQLHEDTLL